MSSCSPPGLMPIDQAIDNLLQSIESCQRPEAETVSLQRACGLVLAEPLRSPVNVPPHDNSAMDGYAVQFHDLDANHSLPISQRIPAGTFPDPLREGTAARIFTGAPVPEGADTVVMQEDCQVNEDGCIVVTESVKAGAHIRRAGEDIREGDEILPAGHRLRPEDMGLIASVGIADVSVYKPLRVAILVSGDELLEPGQAPEPGKIYNSNQYMVAPLLQQLGLDVVMQQKVADTLDATLAALKSAAAAADVIITTGGVSVGEEDHLKPAVEQLGQLDLWKVNIKPGKPFAFGWVDAEANRRVPFIGLPGNPVSVFTTLLVLGIPYLTCLQGGAWKAPVASMIPAAFAVKKPGKRDEYLRVRLTSRNGKTVLEKYPNQGSGVLSSTVWANGFVVLKAGQTSEEGDLLPFLWLEQLLWP